MMADTRPQPRGVLRRADLPALFNALDADGRAVISPIARDGAVVYDRMASADDLPAGLIDEQEAGHYRLHDDGDDRLFRYTCGPGSAKRFLHPPEVVLFEARQVGQRLEFIPGEAPQERLALIGLRACDIAAIAVQDRVMVGGAHADPHYAARRSGLFVVAVQCGRAGATCFCASMGSGPRLGAGSFDLALTEVVDDAGHRFVVEVGSAAGEALADQLPLDPLDAEDADAPARAASAAEGMMTRRLPASGLRERLLDALDSSHWDDVAARCIGCANCTLVCPTCFCTDVSDVTDLEGHAQRIRRWDSCFHPDHSYLHGKPLRAGLAARYRQWLTHKLATWYDQFGTSGCVGCGRCVTWCPVGIDLVAEARRVGGLDAEGGP
jgi:ferredoxin